MEKVDKAQQRGKSSHCAAAWRSSHRAAAWIKET